MATYNNVITNVSGSVGIGTTNASSRLTVLGNSSLPSEPIATFKPGGSQTGGVGVLDVQNSAGTSILFVTGSQRVGIGTLTPGAGLHVVSSLNVGSIFSSTNLTQFYLQFAYNTGTTFGYLGNGTGLVTGGGNADLALRSEAGGSILFAVGGSTERVRFDTSGNVGIGASTYTARLFVSGSSTTSTPTMIVREGVVSPTGGAGTFNVQNSAGNSLLFVSGSGNVGIGTGVPSSKFEVVGVSGSLFSVTDQLSGSLFSVNTISGLPILEVFSDNTLVAGAFNSNALVVSGSNVGIGTTNPGARLQVSGSTSTTEPSLLVRHGVANGSSIPVINAQNSAGTSLLWLSGSGFVGVGTSSNIASNKMAVYGATAPDTFAGHILLSSDTASSGINNGGQLNFQMYDGSSLRGAGFIKGGKENGTASNFASYMSFGTRKNGDGFNTERMRIDSDGTVQIGYATAGLGNITRLFVSGSSNSLASVVTIQEGALSASAGATILSVFNRAGSEIFYVTGSGNVGINNGNLVIGTAGKGIDFSITTNSSGSVDSEVLDDYERGTWTPTIATGGGSITLNTAQTKGVYVKIGRMVWIGGHVRSSSVSSPSGATTISGLPFTIETWNAGQAAYMSFFGEWFSATGLTAWAHAGASLFQGLNSIEMFRYTTAGAFSDATAGNWDGSCEFSFTFCYNANV